MRKRSSLHCGSRAAAFGFAEAFVPEVEASSLPSTQTNGSACSRADPELASVPDLSTCHSRRFCTTGCHAAADACLLPASCVHCLHGTAWHVQWKSSQHPRSQPPLLLEELALLAVPVLSGCGPSTTSQDAQIELRPLHVHEYPPQLLVTLARGASPQRWSTPVPTVPAWQPPPECRSIVSHVICPPAAASDACPACPRGAQCAAE